MSDVNTRQQREELYGLQGVYLDAYNAVVRPHQIFPVSYYALRRWAGQLGGAGFWLLTALQQECYRNRGEGWCAVGRDELAAAAGISAASVHRYLHGAGYQESGLCHWVRLPGSDAKRQWSRAAGRMVQATNRYTVTLDAPLARVDQRGLAQYLYEQGAQEGAGWSEVAPALEHLAQLDLGEALGLLDEYAERFEAGEGWEEDAFYPTVGRVAAAAGVKGLEERATAWARLCSDVQSALTGPMWLGTQYFRQRWAPKLGPTLALVVVQLRSRCFWNEKGKRDTVEMFTGDLGRACGCTDERVRQLYGNEWARLFFEATSESQRGRRATTFRVVLREPIAPEDEGEYALRLVGGPVDPQTGQIGMGLGGEDGKRKPSFEHLEGEGKPNSEHLEGQKPNFEQVKPSFEHLEGEGKPNSEHLEGQKPNFEQVKPNFEQHVKHYKHSEGKTLEEKQQQHLVTVRMDDHSFYLVEQENVIATAATVLSDFGIGQPALGEVSRVGSSTALAWCLYAAMEPGLVGRGAAQGYVVNRLRGGDLPDERFVRWARLPAEVWRELWLAAQLSGGELAEWKSQHADWAMELAEWKGCFGDQWPRGPFGDQARPGWAAGRLDGVGEERWIRLEEDEGGRTREREIWRAALGRLQMQMPRATFDTWLRPATILAYEPDGEEGGKVVVGAHCEAGRDWLEHRLAGLVGRELGEVVGRKIEVVFVVRTVNNYG